MSIIDSTTKNGIKDVEFAYYVKCVGKNRRSAKRIARSIKRGAKARFFAREVAESMVK